MGWEYSGDQPGDNANEEGGSSLDHGTDEEEEEKGLRSYSEVLFMHKVQKRTLDLFNCGRNIVAGVSAGSEVGWWV